MTSAGGGFNEDKRSAAPVQTTVLIAFVIVVGLIVGAATLGFVGGFEDSTSVPAGSGECSYTLTFDPRDVAGFADERAASQRYTDGTFPCVLWLDASRDPGFASGKSVTAWRDKSSNGFSVMPERAAPKWATVDGVEAVRFDGTPNSSLSVETTPEAMNVSPDSGLTVTMLVYVTDRDHRNGGLYAIGAADEDTDTAVEMRQSNVPRGRSGSDEWWASPGPDAEITTAGEWAIITHTTDGETGTLFVNGENLGSGGDGLAELGTEVRIGAAGSSRPFEGYVAEYFITNRRLSAGNRNVVQCAMDANHDFVVGLDEC